MRRKIIMIIITVALIAMSAVISRADDEALWTTVTTPDALIILDLSGSMRSLPQGSNPTLYLHGSNDSDDCGDGGPYYASSSGSDCLSTTTLFNATNCTTSGLPYTRTAESSMPTGTLYLTGSTNCSSPTGGGPFTIAKGSDEFNTTNTPLTAVLWISSTKTCGTSYNGPWYKTSGTGHTKSCGTNSVSNYLLTSGNAYKAFIPTANTCATTTGPFYRTSASGYATACKQYTSCTNPFSTAAYSETPNCTGAFYKTSGSGHTTACLANPVSCAITQDMYSESTCDSGDFYKSSAIGHTTRCYRYCNTSCTPYDPIWSATTTCDGPYYTSSAAGRTDCSKKSIAKRAMYDLLDDTNNNIIDSTDVTNLGMRLGLMRYYDCSSQDNDTTHTDPWNYGGIRLSWGITQADNTTTTPYANLYCNNTSCSSVSAYTSGHESIAGFSVTGGTPMAESLLEGRQYLDAHKALDPSATCRQKSIILVTDGEDTYSCGSTGSYTGPSQRRAPVYYAKQAALANYKTYVVGFGANMTAAMQDTLNWMAYYGGTTNPNETQTAVGTPVAVAVNASGPCGTDGTDPSGHTLRGYAFMASNPAELAASLRTAIASIQESTYSFASQASVAAARTESDKFIYEASFEPKNPSGTLKEPFWTGHLKKYEIGTDGEIITPACWDAGTVLRDTDAADRNMITYKGSSPLTEFTTANISYSDLGIVIDGTIIADAAAANAKRDAVVGFYRGEPAYNLENWKLGDLFHTNPVAIKTPPQYFYDPRACSAASHNSFVSSNLRTPVGGNQIMVVGANDGQLHAFRTGDGEFKTSGGNEVWSFVPPNLLQKLAPVAHNSHADRTTLGSHDFFIDGPVQVSDAWLPGSWSSGTTKNASEWKTILTFGEAQGSGDYLWSASSSCYRAYNASDAGGDFTGYGRVWSVTHPYYCGFYALDVTNSTATPTFLWRLRGNSSPPMTLAEGSYLGEAWSKMQTGRIKDGNNEKWVGFIGGGYSNPAITETPGRGFYVIDLRDGSILWKFTYGASASSTTSPYMNLPAPASPMPIDMDNDGFIDTVYMGDLGGNMWRFRLCVKDPLCSASCGASYTVSPPCTSCGTGNWTASRLFASSDTERGLGLSTPSNTHKQIFTMAKATLDQYNRVWVFFGTGENKDPTWKPPTTPTAIPDTSDTKNRLYAVREDLNDDASADGDAIYTHTYTSADLTDVTNSTYNCNSATNHGWYINLSTNTLTRSDATTIVNPVGEKMISDPTIFGGEVYFPSYVPAQGGASACGLAGDAFLYKLDTCTAGGQWDAALAAAAAAAVAAAAANPGDTDLAEAAQTATDATIPNRTDYVGHGIASAILVSYDENYKGDTFGTASGGAGTAAIIQNTGKAKTDTNMTKILYWKDKRVE